MKLGVDVRFVLRFLRSSKSFLGGVWFLEFLSFFCLFREYLSGICEFSFFLLFKICFDFK